MPIVYAQTGIAIDWDWAAELTLWSSTPDRISMPLSTRTLTHHPVTESEAAAQAHRWWRNTTHAPRANGRDAIRDLR